MKLKLPGRKLRGHGVQADSATCQKNANNASKEHFSQFLKVFRFFLNDSRTPKDKSIYNTLQNPTFAFHL